MEYNTSELCDIYQDMVDVLEPMLCSFGGRASFGGLITTVKCFESNGLIRELVKEKRGGAHLADRWRRFHAPSSDRQRHRHHGGRE